MRSLNVHKYALGPMRVASATRFYLPNPVENQNYNEGKGTTCLLPAGEARDGVCHSDDHQAIIRDKEVYSSVRPPTEESPKLTEHAGDTVNAPEVSAVERPED